MDVDELEDLDIRPIQITVFVGCFVRSLPLPRKHRHTLCPSGVAVRAIGSENLDIDVLLKKEL